MKNATVKEVIEYLQKLNPDAVVCKLVPDDDCYSTIEMIKASDGEVSYINDAGDDVMGKIVYIY